ncbi:MAG: EAL domain-containing protein [Desulfuromusa sp.]|jgi:diguanylate cyclase (GGDEF)-like protein/PAS domain S-box-containing protein|nr:EAL domain-containing protein [Desulfuromusa sp.]
MKVWGRLLLFYVFAMFVIGYAFQTTYKHFKVGALDQRTITQQTAYSSVLQSNRILADTFFNEVLKQDKILSLVQKIVHSEGIEQRTQRGLLYRSLFETYQRSKKDVAEILHFQFPDNRSMLCFRMPQKGDDDLTESRPSIVLVNKSLRAVHGYERGMVLDGYRHVYPLIYHGEHVGSVEVSNPYRTIYRKVQQLETSSKTEFVFFQKKVDLFDKLLKEQKKYYITNEIHQDFTRRRHIPELSLDQEQNKEITTKIQSLLKVLKSNDQVKIKMSQGVAFSQFISWNNELFSAVFHPVLNTGGENGGYLVGTTPEPQIQKLADYFWLYYLVTGLILFVVALYRGFLQSVLEQKRKEQKLLKTISSSMGEGVYAIDIRGDITYINPAMEKMLGYPAGELLRQNAHDIFHMSFPGQRCPLQLDPISKVKRCPHMDFKHQQGFPFSVSTVSTPFLENDQIQGSITVVHDITEQIKQQKLIEKDLKLRTAISELYHPLLTKEQTLADIAQQVLRQAKILTGSSLGFIGEIDAKTGGLIVHTDEHPQQQDTISTTLEPLISLKNSEVIFSALHREGSGEFKGNTSDSLPETEAIQGLLSGHIPLQQPMTVPVMIDDKRFGQITLANAGPEYTKEDQETIKQLADFFALTIKRHHVEMLLRRYEKVITTNTDLIAFIDTDRTYLSANNVYLTYYGLEEKDIIGKNVADIIDKDRYKKVVEKKMSDCLSGVPLSYECWLEYPGVGLRNMDISLTPYLENNGRISGAVIRARDITNQTEQEKELILSAKVFESTTEGIIITDREGTIKAINPAFCRITGYPDNEILGENPRILKSDRHDQAYYQQMWQSLEKSGQWQGEIWNKRKNGETYPEWLTISSIRDDRNEITHYVGVFSDISAINDVIQKLDHQAHHHPLTELPNRQLLHARLNHSIQQAIRGRNQGAVLFIDLDNFKHVNDSLGHAAGDEVLREVAERLKEHSRKVDTVAHIGGDEFVVVMDQVRSIHDVTIRAEQLLKRLKQPFSVGDYEFYLSGSIGITVFPDDGDSVDLLLKNADTAMYKAKENCKNCFQIYSPKLTEEAYARVMLESQLRRALERKELILYYQPQVTFSEEKIVSCEALVRWQHPEVGLILPDNFIPLSEETGLIIPMGEWILRTACQQLVSWRAQGFEIRRIAVNLSGRQIQQKQLPEMVQKILLETGLPGDSLELEITEGFIMQHPEQAITVLQQIRDLGVELSIDDFGTGHSSLNYLKRLPVNRLKIDRSFINDIQKSSEDEAIVRAIIALGHSLKLQVTAEGIETTAQRDFLASLGCDEAQGYLYSRPVPAEQINSLLQREKGKKTE